MKMGLMVEDRDTAFLFLDCNDMPAEATPVDVQTSYGAVWSDAENEDLVVWTSVGDGTPEHRLVVVPRAGFDFENGDYDVIGFPIPTPIIVLNTADYQRYRERD